MTGEAERFELAFENFFSRLSSIMDKNPRGGGQELLEKKLNLLIQLMMEANNPFVGGAYAFESDEGVELKESKRAKELLDEKNKAGFVYGALAVFNGVGGKNCSGNLRLDGVKIHFDKVQIMKQNGLETNASTGWFVSSYDTKNDRYAVAMRLFEKLVYNRNIGLFVTNNNAVTATSTNDVTVDWQLFRYKRNERLFFKSEDQDVFKEGMLNV